MMAILYIGLCLFLLWAVFLGVLPRVAIMLYCMFGPLGSDLRAHLKEGGKKDNR